MERCDGSCGEHGSLMTDISWLKKSLYIGFTIILGSIGYVHKENLRLHNTSMEAKNEMKIEISKINTAKHNHEMGLAKLTGDIETISTYCCGELDVIKSSGD